jgi:UDP-hydrolysing UDP-N-acetyl-D-glucosamine 2-epimerase
MIRKICFITGTRAEYGLLKPLMEECINDDSFEVQIIATGMHLSPEFGLTYREIEQDGFIIHEKIEILLSSDSRIGVSKAMGLALISFAEAYERLEPDLLVGLGDRFELFSAVSAANVANIPVAHLHGGELTFGAFDEGFRHSITKMSHLHFAATEKYRKRIIQLGEHPKTVFNVGAIGLDNFKNSELLSRHDLQKDIGFNLTTPFCIITFHPVTLESNSAENQFIELLKALDNFDTHRYIFTYPNADNEGRSIIKMINEYVSRNTQKAIAFVSLGQKRYLSVLQFADMMIGNSSSGIIEMPYLKKPTINIGNRQKGREFSDSIIQCGTEENSIVEAIKKGLSKEFEKICHNQKNIFGNGDTAKKIKKTIIRQEFNQVIKKEFYDL